MMSEVERRILELASKNQLITKEEIARTLNRSDYNGTDTSVSRLQEMGFLSKIESLGTSFVITQKGIRAANGHV
jgi:arginine repressor